MNKKTFFNLLPILFLFFTFCIGCKENSDIGRDYMPMKWQLESCSNPAIITTLSPDPVIDARGIGELTIRCTNADTGIISGVIIDGVPVDYEYPGYIMSDFGLSGYEDGSIKVSIEKKCILKIYVKDNSVKTNYEIRLGAFIARGSVYLNLRK